MHLRQVGLQAPSRGLDLAGLNGAPPDGEVMSCDCQGRLRAAGGALAAMRTGVGGLQSMVAFSYPDFLAGRRDGLC